MFCFIEKKIVAKILSLKTEKKRFLYLIFSTFNDKKKI